MSHTSKDKAVVRRVAAYLHNAGVKYWLDETEIKPGESLMTKMGQTLKESPYVAVFLSSASIKSSWIEKELSIVMHQEMAACQGQVIPVRLDNCELPPFLVDKYSVDLRSEDNWDQEIAKMLKVLGAGFWKFSRQVTYYEAIAIAEKTILWRLPSIEEAEAVRKHMREAGIEALALWTSTWKDGEVSYVLGYEKGERVECYGIDHFASLDCVLVKREDVSI